MATFHCPSCGNPKTGVHTTVPDGSLIRRYRKCPACGHGFVTREEVEPKPPGRTRALSTVKKIRWEERVYATR